MSVSTVANAAASSAASYAINAVAPGWGTVISTALGMVSGLFGGKLQRQSLTAGILPDASGTFKTVFTGQKNSSPSTAAQFGDAISQGLNDISKATGVMFKSGGQIETNIGEKDPGTWFDNKKISSKPGDVEAAIKSVLDYNNFNYDLLNAPAKTINQDEGSNVNKAFVTLQDGNDPMARLSQQSGSSSYILIGGALLIILALMKKG